MTKASNILSLNISSEIQLKDFSFSQLIIAVKNLFDTEGIPGFIKVLVILIENMVVKSGVCCPRCQSEKHHFHSKTDRNLKTSVGIVNLVLTRVICAKCKKTFCPMTRLFDLNQYSRKSREFEKLSLEMITNQSCQKNCSSP